MSKGKGASGVTLELQMQTFSLVSFSNNQGDKREETCKQLSKKCELTKNPSQLKKVAEDPIVPTNGIILTCINRGNGTCMLHMWF